MSSKFREFDVKLFGHREIKHALDRLGPDQGRAIAMSMRQATKRVLIPELERTAPVDTGELQDSFKTQTSSSKKKGLFAASVGADPKHEGFETTGREGNAITIRKIRPARYLHLVEMGHKKGKGKSIGRPNPFMQRAMRRKRAAMERVFMETINKSIEKVWKSIGRRAMKNLAKEGRL